jgi:poly-gamma-glutamate capsule biosynthesis protein CapA/YwtB (metallophosphatase superfamily)
VNADQSILLGFVGDVLVDREDDPSIGFALVQEVLDVPDILFGNAECVLDDDPCLAPSAAVVAITPTRNAAAFGGAGFDVMSVANNHIVDAGHEGMHQTIGLLREQGIATSGAGENLAAASKPAIVERAGTTVAYLSYASFFPVGYEARDDWPGLAPMRSYNHYEQKLPNLWAPGADAICHAVPVAGDLERLRTDIAAARGQADVVVASFHWGDYQKPFHITEHERIFAHAAVDAGADIVVGHHQHILRGVEWYGGKPIFYGLGHFVFDLALPDGGPAALVEKIAVDPENDDYYGLAERPGWPLHPWHPDARMTAVAWVQVSGGDVVGAGLLPCRLNPQGQVVPLDAASPEGAGVLAYLQRCCDTQGLETAVRVGGVELAGFGSAALIEECPEV